MIGQHQKAKINNIEGRGITPQGMPVPGTAS
jgi:hypothetical protein